jgi:hypothetical protein
VQAGHGWSARARPLIIVAGLIVVVVGLLVWSGGLRWIGRLAGDLRIERDGVRMLVLFTSTLLVSVVVPVMVALLRRLG